MSNAEKRRVAQRERMRYTQQARRRYEKETGKKATGKAWDEYRERYLSEHYRREPAPVEAPVEEAPKPVDETLADQPLPELKVEAVATAQDGKVYVEGTTPIVTPAAGSKPAPTGPLTAGAPLASRVTAWRLTAKTGHRVLNGVVASYTDGAVKKTEEQLSALDEAAYAAIDYYAQMGKLPEMNPLYGYIGAVAFAFGFPIAKHYIEQQKKKEQQQQEVMQNDQRQ